MERHYTKEDKQMANKPMKRCPTLCVIRELQIKTTSYHSTSIRMAKIQIPNADEEAEQQEFSFNAGGKANGTFTIEDSLAVFCHAIQ